MKYAFEPSWQVGQGMQLLWPPEALRILEAKWNRSFHEHVVRWRATGHGSGRETCARALGNDSQVPFTAPLPLASSPKIPVPHLIAMSANLLVRRCGCVVVARVRARPRVSAVVVEELLQGAVKSSLEAPNRALKRRVRQRLHKKPLGSVDAKPFKSLSGLDRCSKARGWAACWNSSFSRRPGGIFKIS